MAWQRHLNTKGARWDNGNEIDFARQEDGLNNLEELHGTTDSIRAYKRSQTTLDFGISSWHHFKDSVTGEWHEYLDIDTTGLGGSGTGGGHVLKNNGAAITVRPNLTVLSNGASDLRDSSEVSSSILDFRRFLPYSGTNSGHLLTGSLEFQKGYDAGVVWRDSVGSEAYLHFVRAIENSLELYSENGTTAEAISLSLQDGNSAIISGNSSSFRGLRISAFNPLLATDVDNQTFNTTAITAEVLAAYVASHSGTTLPSQAGNSGKFLTTSGSVLSWANPSFTTLTGVPSWIVSDSVVHFNRVYGDPAFVGSLAWSKVTGAPSFLTSITGSQVNSALGYTAADAATVSTNTSNISTNTTAIALKGNIAGQTWTGTHAFSSTTSIGSVSSAELAALDGVTSGIQGQLDTKAGYAMGSASVSGSVSLDLSTITSGTTLTVTGNITTFAVNNGVAGKTYYIYMVQDGTGSRTITGFDSKLHFQGSTTPYLNSAASSRTLYQIIIYSSTVYDLIPVYDLG